MRRKRRIRRRSGILCRRERTIVLLTHQAGHPVFEFLAQHLPSLPCGRRPLEGMRWGEGVLGEWDHKPTRAHERAAHAPSKVSNLWTPSEPSVPHRSFSANTFRALRVAEGGGGGGY